MADEADGEKKKGNLLLIISLVVGGLLLIVIGLGVGYLVFGGSTPDPSEEVEQLIERKDKSSKPAEPEEDDADEEEGAEGEDGAPAKLTKIAPEIETFQTTYYEFVGNMTTNLKGSRKFLQLGVGVATQYDDTVMANVDTHQLALRSEILAVMSEFTETDVQGREGKLGLAKALQDAMNARLEVLEGFGGIESVHFTSFVLQ
jgi:flagellar FliL protein